MTVQELIFALNKYPLSMTVVLEGGYTPKLDMQSVYIGEPRKVPAKAEPSPDEMEDMVIIDHA